MTAPAPTKRDIVRVSENPPVLEVISAPFDFGCCSRDCGTNVMGVDDDVFACGMVDDCWLGVLVGKNESVAVGDVVVGKGPAVGTDVGLNVLVVEGLAVGGTVHDLQ